MLFETKLLDLLKTDPRFVDDNDELVLAMVQDATWKMGRALVKLFLSDQEIKAEFFEDIEGQEKFNTKALRREETQQIFAALRLRVKNSSIFWRRG